MLYIYWSEIRRIAKKNKKILLSSLIGFTCSIILIGLSLEYFSVTKEYGNRLEESYGGKEYYKILYSNDLNKLYEKVFRDKTIEKVQMALTELDSNTDFIHSYTEEEGITFLSRESRPAFKVECQVGYEDGEINADYLALKAIFADKNFFNGRFLSIESGRKFFESEFSVSDKKNITLPVVLGNDYSKLYKIGDVLEDGSLWDETKIDFKVVGFLRKDSYCFNARNDKIVLNRYIIVPSITPTYNPVLEDGTIDHFYSGALEVNKLMNSRIICKKGASEHVKREVISILNKYELFDFYLVEETKNSVRVYEQSLYFARLALSVTIVTVIVCFLMLVLSIYNKVLSELKTYSIYLLLGFDRKKIFLIASIETFLTFIIGNLLAGTVFVYLYTIGFAEILVRIPIITLIIAFQILLLIIMWFIVMGNVMKDSLSSSLQRKE